MLKNNYPHIFSNFIFLEKLGQMLCANDYYHTQQ